jgi:3-deoxy-7-phosphoheptulonate synthase
VSEISNQIKLAARAEGSQTTEVVIGESVKVGGKPVVIIGGPCTVENAEQMEIVASKLKGSVNAIRGGVHKPRTSPYAFQGMGEEGLDILQSMSQKHSLPTVTEVMSVEQIAACAEKADMLQIGSRNMQNFELLKALGKVNKPILLKRGLTAIRTSFFASAASAASTLSPATCSIWAP